MSDTDTGAIGGSDDDTAVPDNLNTDFLNPLTVYVEKWPAFSSGGSKLGIGPSINMELAMLQAVCSILSY